MLDLTLPWFGGLITFGGLVVFVFVGLGYVRAKVRISVHQKASKKWHRKALLTLFSHLKNGTLDIMQTC